MADDGVDVNSNVIDPQLRGEDEREPHFRNGQNKDGTADVPLRQRNGDDDGSNDDEDVEQSGKRRKLNLLKCTQCRAARKKCFPTDRIWPQKCNRCASHRPEPLECSEPQLNTRKRGPNLPKSSNLKTPLMPTTVEFRSSPERLSADYQSQTQSQYQSISQHPPPIPVPQHQHSHLSHQYPGSESPPSSDDVDAYERPKRTTVGRLIKRDNSGVPKLPPQIAQIVKLRQEDPEHPPAAYTHLSPKQFRILRLEPGKDEPLVCSLEKISMREVERGKIDYETVSYLWSGTGQEELKPTTVLHLKDSKEGIHNISIRNNLASALKSLRHPSKARLFWVDALCINHNNMPEKNEQIAIKRFIFHNASNACFWLGEDANSKRALRFIPRIVDLSKVDRLVADDNTIEDWLAFIGLLKNPVFSRLWLLQEVAVAKEVTLHCGLPAVHYKDLADAVAIFVSVRAKVSHLFRKNNRNPKELVDRRMRIAERFIDVSLHAFFAHDFRIYRPLSLEELVSQLSELGTGNPLDRIYAILPIASDGPALEEDTLKEKSDKNLPGGIMSISYGKSISEVFQKFVIHVLNNSTSLDIICRPWASSVPDVLPTWVRPLQFSSQPQIDVNSLERPDADSLVGLPRQSFYNASRGFPKSCTYGGLLEGGSLGVKGFVIDKIEKLAFRAPEGTILQEWLVLGGCSSSDSPMTGLNITPNFDPDRIPESFWRTIVGDRGPGGVHTPGWYARAFSYCLLNLTATCDINTNRLIAENDEYSNVVAASAPGFKAEASFSSSLVVSFLQRVQSVIWNRRFFVTKNRQYTGLAPNAAREDDIVAILSGCSVPVVLRPVSQGRGFQLVGECYVHGIMNGEAIEIKKKMDKADSINGNNHSGRTGVKGEGVDTEMYDVKGDDNGIKRNTPEETKRLETPDFSDSAEDRGMKMERMGGDRGGWKSRMPGEWRETEFEIV